MTGLFSNFFHQLMSSNAIYSFLLALIMFVCDYVISHQTLEWHAFALALVAFAGNYASTEYNKFKGVSFVPTVDEQPKQAQQPPEKLS